MYYEIHGKRGMPLLLLHGSMGSLKMFRPLLPALTTGRQVIAVDQQAHGRTADVDRPLRYEQLADDAAAFLQWLEFDQADIFGFSMESAAGWQLAVGTLSWCVSWWARSATPMTASTRRC
jgi:pimeloyl-ACP methyl ester carboxylesterase